MKQTHLSIVHAFPAQIVNFQRKTSSEAFIIAASVEEKYLALVCLMNSRIIKKLFADFV